MARLTINIGVAGNDATGDSIRESFRKVNENFREIYDIFSEGGLNNVTGIKFAGPLSDATNVRVTKFSNTAYFTTQLNEPQYVPTETAIENYITRRLGLDHKGNTVDNADSIEPLVPIQTGVNGFMDRDGRLPYLGGTAAPFNVNSSKIVNLLQPTAPSDASTKSYVDNHIWFNEDELLVIDNGDNASISVELNTVPLEKLQKVDSYNVLMNNTPDQQAVTGVSVQDMLNSEFEVSAEISEKVLVWNNGFTFSATSNGDVADSFVKVSANNTVSFKQINSSKIVNLLQPTAPSDASTKSYVDNHIWFNEDELLVIDNGDNASISVELNTVPLEKLQKVDSYNVLMNNTPDQQAVTGVSVQDMLNSEFEVSAEISEKVLVWNNGFTFSATSNGDVADSFVKVSANNTVSFKQINSPSLSDITTISTVNDLLAVEMYTEDSSPVVVMHGTWELAENSTLESSYADLAEFYEADNEYSPGTVLVFGGDKEVTLSNKMGDHRVAGVVTTAPAYVMNKKCPGKKVCIALQGRVPVLIIGRAKKGDILVAAARPGHAMVCNTPSPGTIIGKCLEDKVSDAPGFIEASVGRF